ncbi:unnamed protein product [Colias eurytheme]|nr:unnamed protein product [Colias eurytheme]CAG4965990.1 unnamed protein product [Colias eurytheme]
MSLKSVILFAFLLTLVQCKNIIQGLVEVDGSVRNVYNLRTEAYAIPFIKRDHDIHYDITREYGPISNELIKGIAIRELGDGSSEAALTAGGVGYKFVDIHLESERGSGYKYSIEIFA